MSQIWAGNMVENTLRQVTGNFCKIEEVRATKSKIQRFYPVHSLYEQQMIHHKGRFTELEYELLTFSGAEKDRSPNSVDAMVHGINYLNDHGKSSVGYY